MRLNRRIRQVAAGVRHALHIERPIVLMYHRVERLTIDPWQLAVPPERFAAQVALLAAERTVVPFSWLASEIAKGRLPRNAAAITFDDAYADVFRNARPVLEAAGCPATVFVTTGAVGSPAGFWWDILARVLLRSPHLPEVLDFTLEGQHHRLRVSSNDEAERSALLAQVYALLRPAAPDARREVLAGLADASGTDADPRPADLAMTEEEVSALAAGGVIEIGAHSVTHPPMTSLPRHDQVREAAESRRRCAEMAGRPVTTFAYPYGDFDATSAAVVAEAGLSCACTTEPRAVHRGADRFAIPRLLAADWDEDGFRREVLAHG